MKINLHRSFVASMQITKAIMQKKKISKIKKVLNVKNAAVGIFAFHILGRLRKEFDAAVYAVTAGSV